MLIDTNVLIWAGTDPGKLSRRVRAIFNSDETLIVSAVSAYEIEFKRPRNLELQRLPPDLNEVVEAIDASWAAVDPRHCSRAGRLPPIHGDPWDRILVAQAMDFGMPIVSSDGLLARYGVPVIW